MNQIVIIHVQKTDEDGKLIMEWRNDESTRKNSFNQELKVWNNENESTLNTKSTENNFKKEFYNNYFDNIPLFAVLNGKKIGFVSFCEYKYGTLGTHGTLGDYSIGVNLNPTFRGKGLSKIIIKKGVEYIRQNYNDVKDIYAEIKEFNIPSIKGFTRAGFYFIKNVKRVINNKEESINIYLAD
jgi:RimJ/RimL family protein N-acetyltransferase